MSVDVPARLGRYPGKILRGTAAPDALIVRSVADHPPFDWVYAGDLAATLFACSRVNRTMPRRLYAFAKKGYLESCVEFAGLKRFYRLLRPMDDLRAAVAVKYLTDKYT